MKKTKKLLSAILVIAMVVGMIPITSLTAFATTKTEIANLSFTFRNQSEIPTVGAPVIRCSSGAIYEVEEDLITLTARSLNWHDEKGAAINDTFDDHGCYFEAGRTYYAEIVAELDDPETYRFSENAVITLTNPGDFIYSGKVANVTNTITGSSYATIRLTITMNGQRTYPDITKVVFEDTAAPAADSGTVYTDLYYNNCTITEENWYDVNNNCVSRFTAGETYTRKIVLTAKDGYAFDENVDVVLTHIGVSQQPTSKVLSQNNTVLTLTYTYTISGITRIDCVEAQLAYYYVNPTPYAGDTPTSLNNLITVSENHPYEKISDVGRFWYDEDGNGIDNKAVFEAGKTYYFDIAFTIKEEYESEYRFSRGDITALIVGDSYTGKGFQKAERVEDNTFDDTYVKIRYYFTCQFPEGTGNTANNPVVCNNFSEFKFAMENEDIRYVALGDVDEVIPKVDGEGLIPAISVNGIKNLTLTGDSIFTAPAANDGYKTICALLHTEEYDTITIDGTGSLKFRAVANNSYNAVILNQGGSVFIDGGTLIGSYNTAVYGKAIWQSYGELHISDGQLFGENALAPGKLPSAHTAVCIEGGSAWIQGGTFKTENKIDTIDKPYGLDIGKNALVDLSGGTFYGILLPTAITPLANYMDKDIYTPLTNESWFNPDSEYSQEYVDSGKIVRIVKLIKNVDVYINAPVAGVKLSSNYFDIPTTGCQASQYFPQWYKDGKIINHGTFEAGASYKVVIRIAADKDNNVEFASGVTAAINNIPVEVTVPATFNGKEYIEISYDFGKCPNAIGSVELTVTPPEEGKAPSYTVNCASDVYYAVGGSDNYTDFRQWMESTDGESWREMNTTDKFVAGRYYKLYVDIRTMDGYEFLLYDDGSSIQPNVSAVVNGYTAKVIKAYDQDPSRYITVEYNFGAVNDSVIENIVVVDVKEPVGGEYPCYTYNVLGTGYQMDTNKNAYTDVYWTNPPEKWYYIKNGIGWFDLTENDWVHENERFIPGHEYQVNVYLKTEDGYTFWHDRYYEMLFTASVNGNTAEGNTTTSEGLYSQTIRSRFTCEAKLIKSVEVIELAAPVVGSTPVFYAPTAHPSLYEVDSIQWFDENMDEMTDADTFKEGVRYRMVVEIVPIKIDGVNVCKFANDRVTAKINGITVEIKNGEWDEVVSGPKKVTIFYTFEECGQGEDNRLPGDVNCDGSVSNTDLVSLARYMVNLESLDELQLKNADMNGDGEVSNSDLVEIARYIVGL